MNNYEQIKKKDKIIVEIEKDVKSLEFVHENCFESFAQLYNVGIKVH